MSPGISFLPNCLVRWMLQRHMPEVLGIENASFEFPWTEAEFVACVRQRNCVGLVAEVDDKVVGYMIYEMAKSKIRLLNLAVSPEWRRRGVGRYLVQKLINKLSLQKRNRITLEVRETNLPAQLFFRSLGFRATSVLRNFYQDTPEDAYLMSFTISQPEPVILPMNRLAKLAG